MNYFLCSLLVLTTAFMVSCKEEKSTPASNVEVVVVNPPLPEKEVTPEPPKATGVDCSTITTTVKLRTGEKNLPATGKFIVESHYAVQGEVFKANKGLFPSKQTEGISAHLEASCKLLTAKGLTCPNYSKSWEKVWTPSEHGLVGQAARGDMRPTAWQELWQGNLLYSKLPKAGVKYLVKNVANGQALVGSFGFEIGPPAQDGFGGMTVEAMHYLRAVNGTTLWIGELKDQSIDYGPVKCLPDVTWFLPVPTLPVQPPRWVWV